MAEWFYGKRVVKHLKFVKEVTMRFHRLGYMVLAVLLVGLLIGSGALASGSSKYRIGMSMSYYGNGWQTENMNAAMALSKVPPYNQKVDLILSIAGADAQRQNAQLNEFIAMGVNAIILFPISPTALNRTLDEAIKRGILVITYSAGVDDPAVHSIGVDYAEQGRIMAEWLVKQMNYKGNILMNKGVAGTRPQILREKAAKAIFNKYPDIKVVAEINGNWSSAVSEIEATKALAAHPNINGVWSEAGAAGVVRAMLAAGLPLVPTTGESTAGFVRMLADKNLQAKGLVGMTTADPGYDAALALKFAYDYLEGKKIPLHYVMPIPTIYMKDLKAGTDIAAGDNVLPKGIVPDDYFVQMYRPDLPLDLQGYLTGLPGKEAFNRAKALLETQK